jgi:ABC-2 type transport system ATP-binding protein
MIETRAVTKFYGSRRAVRDLSFQIEDHEIVGFLGLNGAGKSTTLRILAGLLAPSHGEVRVDGEDLLGPAGADVRRRIGFLPDRPPVYDEMRVRGYVEFAARLRGFDGSRTRSRVDEVLEQTELTDHASEPIGALSHGYRQRVGIAQAIVHRPALVILDEPTSGLDPVQIAHMRALIRALQDQHTVLVSSHNLPEIEQTCDRLLVMRDGELVASGSESELAARSQMARAVEIDVVGDESTVRAALDAEAARALAADAQTTAVGDLVIVRARLLDAPEALVRHLVERGLGVRRVQPSRGELENLFMELTGASQ